MATLTEFVELFTGLKPEPYQEPVLKYLDGDWPPAPCRFPDDAPKPWYITGKHMAVNNVLKVDYGARRDRQSHKWQVPNGDLTQIYNRWEIQGRPKGTVFVIGYDHSREVEQLWDYAHEAGWQVRDATPPRPR